MAPSTAARPPAIVWAMVAAYAIAYSAMSWLRYRNYLYRDFDLAIFAQAVDGVLRGTWFSSIRGMTWLGDHSSLIMLAVAPIYAVARHPMTLLILQSVALALGAIPLWSLAWRELGNRELAVTCVALYLLQPAMGYANLFAFHPEMLAVPLLIAAFAAIRAGRGRAAMISAGAALTCREDVALVVIMLALYTALHPRQRQPKLALGLFAAALASIALTWGVLRPLFSRGEVELTGVYAQWGASGGEAFRAMATHPLQAIAQLLVTPGHPRESLIKLQYHLALELPLAFLPLLSPATLALALPAFAEHLLSWRVPQHTIFYHYTALVLPFLSTAMVLGMRNLLIGLSPPRARNAARRGAPPAAPRRTAIAIMVAAAAAAACSVATFGPLVGSASFFVAPGAGRWRPSGEDRAAARYLDRMIARVPARGAVIAGFESLARFTTRDSVHSLHHVLRGTYTFSARRYPPPVGVGALVGDLAASAELGNIGPFTASRLQAVIAENRLEPVDAAGDLVLFLAGGRDPVPLVTTADADSFATRAIVFDRELAYLGGGLIDSLASSGGLARFRTSWRKIGAIDRYYLMDLALDTPDGKRAWSHTRGLGYLFASPNTWPADRAVTEDYRLLVPDDLPAGDYVLSMRLHWLGANSGEAVADDPSRYSAAEGLRLGTLHVRNSHRTGSAQR